MTHLLDTSALLAHYLGEPGADRIQSLFEDATAIVGTSILAMYEFDLRLHLLGIDATSRMTELNRYGALLSEIVNVDEAVRSEAVSLRVSASARVSAMDTLIAATASSHRAVLVHRDPHFSAISAGRLKQELLPSK